MSGSRKRKASADSHASATRITDVHESASAKAPKSATSDEPGAPDDAESKSLKEPASLSAPGERAAHVFYVRACIRYLATGNDYNFVEKLGPAPDWKNPPNVNVHIVDIHEIPNDQSELVDWMNNFCNKVPLINCLMFAVDHTRKLDCPKRALGLLRERLVIEPPARKVEVKILMNHQRPLTADLPAHGISDPGDHPRLPDSVNDLISDHSLHTVFNFEVIDPVARVRRALDNRRKLKTTDSVADSEPITPAEMVTHAQVWFSQIADSLTAEPVRLDSRKFLRQVISGHRQEISGLSQEISDLRNQITRLEAEAAVETAVRASLKEALAAKERSLDEMGVRAEQERKNFLQIALQNANQPLEQLHDRVRDKEQEISRLQSSNRDLETRLMSCQTENTSLRSSSHNQKTRLNSCQTENTRLRSSRQKLTSKLKACQSVNAKQRARRLALESFIQQMADAPVAGYLTFGSKFNEWRQKANALVPAAAHQQQQQHNNDAVPA